MTAFLGSTRAAESAESTEVKLGAVDDPFRADATRVLGRFRESLERVVYSVARGLQSSRDLENVLGVDRSLSWQLFKLLGPIETLSTATYVPAATSMRKMLSAAKKRGAAAADVAEAGAAFAALEEFIAGTTGDREAFETMVVSYTDSPESVRMGLHHRKSAFKADCHYFGAAADTSTVAVLFHPGGSPDRVDLVVLRQLLGVRRLRASADMVVDRWKVSADHSGLAGSAVPGDALDPAAAAEHRAAVLPGFCTRPLLPLATRVDPSGDVRTVLEHRDIGVGREVDVTTGRVYRGIELQRTPDGRPVFEGLIEIARPTRVQVIDNFVHRPTWPSLMAKSGVYAHLSSRAVAEVDRNGVRLPFSERLSYMGSGPDVLRINESPRYLELVRHGCQLMGWAFEDMDLYRIRIEYPLMDTNVMCRVEAIKSA
jgi:hypothetical protein